MNRNLLKSKIVFSLCLFLTLSIAQVAYPQQTKYPTRPISWIYPYTPGSPAEIAFRLLAKEAEKDLGQPIVVVSKPGAGATIGLAAIASAVPDGYTTGMMPGAGSMFTMPFMEKVPYNVLKDFRFIVQYAGPFAGVAVNAKAPFKNFKDLISYARQNPKKLTYGTNAPNGLGNLVMESIAKKEGVQFTHIPHKGTMEFMAALLGEHISFVVGEIPYSAIEAGEARMLLFMGGDKRFEDFPDIPVQKEFGYDLPYMSYTGLMAPRAIPNDIANRLEEVFTKAMKQPSFIKAMKEIHQPIVYRSGKDLEAYVTFCYESMGKNLKEIGLIK
jgi:tripartite-type tricarboxylate transporter receptor subunit TctC